MISARSRTRWQTGAKLMVVSYPNNPTAALATDQWYEDCIAFAKKHDIIVLHDNAYSELVFDTEPTGSFLAHPGAREVGVEFNSLSKTYGLAGARIGFCIGNSRVVEQLARLKSNMDYGMFLPIQKAAIAAITGDQSCVKTTRKRIGEGETVSATDAARSAGRWTGVRLPCSYGRRFRKAFPLGSFRIGSAGPGGAYW